MTDTQQQFIEFSLQQKVLKFGHFTLKSGRVSPYFFNAGLFNSGKSISRLGQFYAQTIIDSGIEFDMLFGPAYKGIPLACATSIALAEKYGRDVPWCFNRKEEKDHGEGGLIVGAPLKGRVLVIDDVITAGTAVNESSKIIRQNGADFSGVVIAIDRQERGREYQDHHLSAIQEIERQYAISVISVTRLNDLIVYLQDHPDLRHYLAAISDYRNRYGA